MSCAVLVAKGLRINGTRMSVYLSKEFVEREFYQYLDCGILGCGFVRVRCDGCPIERIVVFSCKKRGICPSCTARRMSDTAAHVVDNVLPQVPYRQWVLSFPRQIRFLLAKNATLLGLVLDVTLRKLFAWQKRKARMFGMESPQCGSVPFVQRFGSLLNLNCHFHSLLPDGVFVEHGGVVSSRPIPPSNSEIETLLKQIAMATIKCIRRYSAAQEPEESNDYLSVAQAQTLHRLERLCR